MSRTTALVDQRGGFFGQRPAGAGDLAGAPDLGVAGQDAGVGEREAVA